MTTDTFRSLALSFPDTEEKAHMNHPDFRAAGKVFATMGYPAEGWAMVRLTPEQQQEFVHDYPEVFIPVKGAWGKQGCTNVLLKKARKPAVQQALRAAWSNRTQKRIAKATRIAGNDKS